MQTKIRTLLDTIKHPETGAPLHDGGFVDAINASPEKIVVTLRFEKARDPFSLKLKHRAEELLKSSLTHLGAQENCSVMVMVKEGVAPRKVQPKEIYTTLDAIGHTVVIASGKGGVGKSSVTANTAIALRDLGYRVGVLDADIYGPSQAQLFGVSDYLPEAVIDEKGHETIIPAEAHGVKLISIAMFIKATDPLMWRGTMASNALKQLLHQTAWGGLDFLLIDLPPGTGDIHLTLLSEIKRAAAVIVSTPQGVALADVVRGVEMFRHEKVQMPIIGIVENMAYFSPDDAPEKKYYIFGRGGATQYAAKSNLELLGEVPIFEAIMQGGEDGNPAATAESKTAEIFNQIAQRIIAKV